MQGVQVPSESRAIYRSRRVQLKYFLLETAIYAAIRKGITFNIWEVSRNADIKEA